MLAGDGLIAFLRRTWKRLRVVERYAVARKFREQDHVDPGKAAPDRGDFRRDDIQIVAGRELELQRSEAESARSFPPRPATG